MSLTLLTYPADTCSVSNEMLFVIQESVKAVDPVTYPNYKYVLDVYVASALVARMKVNPDPVNSFGIFDVSKILQNYATYGFADLGQKSDHNIKIDYQVKLGEEYSDTIYTNLITDSARSCFQTYKPKPFTSSVAIVDGLASNMPAITNQHRSNAHVIFNAIFDNTSPNDFVVVFKNENTTIHTEDIVNTDYAVANKIRRIDLGSLFTTWAGQSTHVLITCGSEISFRINILCNAKYTPYTLVWLNPYGGYESQSFGLVSKKSIEVDKKYYTKLDYEINASGVVSYKADNVYYGGKRGYASKVKTKLSLTSHLLSDGEYTWLADLFASPDIYFYDGSNFIPVSITETNYEHRTYLNSKVTPLQFSIEFGTDYNTQLL